MNYKILLFFTFLFLNQVNSGFAQNENFLIVSSSDTIILSPNKIHYNIAPVRDYNPSGIPSSKKTDIAKTLTEIKEILTRNNFNFNESGYQGEYTIYTAKDNPLNNVSLQVTLDDEESLKKLVSLIKGVDNISGNIAWVEFEENSEADAELIKKVLDKSRKKANLIADNMNCEIEYILSFTEITKGIESIISNEMNKRSSGWGIVIDNSLERVLELSANVKFLIKRK